ncbi:MAG: hypothetical protein ACREPZ_07415 [Rhodanobacteraceae bacterium]
MKILKTTLLVGLTGAMATGLALAASAPGNGSQEISTAHAHALLAKSATTVAMSQTHLHHVINCLVGPNGTGFDAAAGNPCKGQGNGAIPDSAADSTLHGKLQSALSDAQAGLKADSLTAVQSDAGKAAVTLQDASGAGAAASSSW